MRTAIKNLRRKLGDDAKSPKYVFNVPRVGYLMPTGERRDRNSSRHLLDQSIAVRMLTNHPDREQAFCSAAFDNLATQCYSCVMIPEFEPGGNLPPGVHWATWSELYDRFGTTRWRRRLLVGLRAALENLQSAGCLTAYVDGSFVSSKSEPGDFDACWEVAGVDPERLDPVLLIFDDGRAAQKAKYSGEFFPVSTVAGFEQRDFLDFFQTDKDTGARKGIVALDLGGLT